MLRPRNQKWPRNERDLTTRNEKDILDPNPRAKNRKRRYRYLEYNGYYEYHINSLPILPSP
jgi:hypothetical protein